jgi:hypothetical protein
VLKPALKARLSAWNVRSMAATFEISGIALARPASQAGQPPALQTGSLAALNDEGSRHGSISQQICPDPAHRVLSHKTTKPAQGPAITSPGRPVHGNGSLRITWAGGRLNDRYGLRLSCRMCPGGSTRRHQRRR